MRRRSAPPNIETDLPHRWPTNRADPRLIEEACRPPSDQYSVEDVSPSKKSSESLSGSGSGQRSSQEDDQNGELIDSEIDLTREIDQMTESERILLFGSLVHWTKSLSTGPKMRLNLRGVEDTQYSEQRLRYFVELKKWYLSQLENLTVRRSSKIERASTPLSCESDGGRTPGKG